MKGARIRRRFASLQALSARVLYPNSKDGRITLVGDYNAQTQLFRLEHWYLRVPFIEITLEDRLQMPEEIKGNQAGVAGADRF